MTFYLLISPTRVENLSAADFENKNCSEILADNEISDQIIALQTPAFRNSLQLSTCPLKEHQCLIMETKPEFNFPPPPSHLLVVHSSESKLFYFSASIKSNMTVDFPIIYVPVSEINGQVSELIESFKSCFPYANSSSPIKLYFKGDEVDKAEKIKTLYSQIINSDTSDLLFECEIDDSISKKIRMRECACAEVISSEESFLSDLKYLIDFWEVKFTSANLFEANNLPQLFHHLHRIQETHEGFLTHLKTPPIKYAGMFGCRFLNWYQKFLTSKAFISNFKARNDMIKEKRQSKSFDQKFKEIEKRSPNGRIFFRLCCTYPKISEVYNFTSRT
jgi:hypothetical protein